MNLEELSIEERNRIINLLIDVVIGDVPVFGTIGMAEALAWLQAMRKEK